jgi:hypothetical protein
LAISLLLLASLESETTGTGSSSGEARDRVEHISTQLSFGIPITNNLAERDPQEQEVAMLGGRGTAFEPFAQISFAPRRPSRP